MLPVSPWPRGHLPFLTPLLLFGLDRQAQSVAPLPSVVSWMHPLGAWQSQDLCQVYLTPLTPTLAVTLQFPSLPSASFLALLSAYALPLSSWELVLGNTMGAESLHGTAWKCMDSLPVPLCQTHHLPHMSKHCVNGGWTRIQK